MKSRVAYKFEFQGSTSAPAHSTTPARIEGAVDDMGVCRFLAPLFRGVGVNNRQEVPYN